MIFGFVISALIILGGALAAILLSNLVHCAFGLALSLLGVAALYLQLGAEFIGFAQILVYVGAVAILIVFAILLTQNKTEAEVHRFAPQWIAGLGAVVLVFGLLFFSIRASRVLHWNHPHGGGATPAAIGHELMAHYILPLEAMGLLLTVALIGGVILAMPESLRERPGLRRD